MRSAGLSVGHRGFCGAAFVANSEQIHYLSGFFHDEFSHSSNTGPIHGILAQIQVLVSCVRDQQIQNHFVVNLNVWHFYTEIFVYFSLLDRFKEILQDEYHYTWTFKRASHRECLATASCTIGEDARVVAANNTGNKMSASVLIHFECWTGLSKYSVKEVSLFFWPVKYIGLFILFRTLNLYFVHYDEKFVLNLKYVEIFVVNLFSAEWSDTNWHNHVRVVMVFLKNVFYEVLFACFVFLLLLFLGLLI